MLLQFVHFKRFLCLQLSSTKVAVMNKSSIKMALHMEFYLLSGEILFLTICTIVNCFAILLIQLCGQERGFHAQGAHTSLAEHPMPSEFPFVVVSGTSVHIVAATKGPK